MNIVVLFIFRHFMWRFIFQVLLSTCNFLLSLYIAYFIGNVVIGLYSTDHLIYLISVILLKYLIIFLQAKLNVSIVSSVTSRLIASLKEIKNDEGSGASVIRDIPLLTDLFPSVFLAFSHFLSLGLTFYLLIYHFGQRSISAFLTLIAIAPISIAISKFATRYTNRYLDLERGRVKNIEKWYDKKFFAFNWKKLWRKEVLNKELILENKYRNIDSTIRISETYFSAFGRIIPLFVLYLFSDFSNENSLMFWICIPAIDLILTLSRHYADLKACERVYSSFKENLEEKRLDVSENIRVNLNAKFFRGSILENIFVENEASRRAYELLNLDQELAPLREISNYIIEESGKNLSTGQKIRLNIVKYVAVAYEAKKKLDLEGISSYLDLGNIQRVINLASEMKKMGLSLILMKTRFLTCYLRYKNRKSQ